MNTFPALNGEVVTEQTTRICAERGHATHTVAGVEQSRCPRCGELKVVEPTEKFDRMLKLESEVRHSCSMASLGIDRDTRWRGQENFRAAKAELHSLLDSLTIDQAKAYGEYRKG